MASRLDNLFQKLTWNNFSRKNVTPAPGQTARVALTALVARDLFVDLMLLKQRTSKTSAEGINAIRPIIAPLRPGGASSSGGIAQGRRPTRRAATKAC